MPLDGLTALPQPNGWTIKVGPTSEILAQSRHWPQRKRKAYHKLAAAAAYKAIDAIQLNELYRRRAKINCRGSWVRYFFRRDAREKRTILVTIFEFHFHDPDPRPEPPDGNRSPMAIDLLILNVSGSGRRYSIDYVEGVLPRPPARNLILSMLGGLELVRGKLRLVGGVAERNGSIKPIIERIDGAIYYSPQRSKTSGRFDPNFTSLYQQVAIETKPQAYWASQLRRAFKAIGVFRKGDANGIDHGATREMRRFTYSPGDGAYTVIEGRHPAASRMIAQTRSALQNYPIRPHDSQ